MWTRTLDDECRAFTHYLIRQSPTDYVLHKYQAAHRIGLPLDPGLGSRFERFLVAFSLLHPLATRLVDVYTSVFQRGTLVRRKWVLLLAVVETCFPTFAYFDAPDTRSATAFYLRAAWNVLAFCLALCLALVLLAPIQLALSVGPLLLGRLSRARALTAPATPAALLAPGPALTDTTAADFASASEAPFEGSTLAMGK